MVEPFLLGIIVSCSLIAGMFFLKFWRQTRDGLFLAFGIAFVVEGINRASLMLMDQPNRGHVAIYVVRLLCYVLILGAIVMKNVRRTR